MSFTVFSYNATVLLIQHNPTQPNPWMDPTHVHLWSTCGGDDAVADKVVLVGDQDKPDAGSSDPRRVLQTLLDVGERLSVGHRVDE